MTKALVALSRCSKVRCTLFLFILIHFSLQKIRAAGVQGKLEETVIGFSIDNGGVPYAGALNYPLRGAKVSLKEGNAAVYKQDIELSGYLVKLSTSH